MQKLYLCFYNKSVLFETQKNLFVKWEQMAINEIFKMHRCSKFFKCEKCIDRVYIVSL